MSDSDLHTAQPKDGTAILLLEDDFTLSREIGKFLNTGGFRCDTVYDGQLFLRQIKLSAYDLFILDINVPGINGLDVCRSIRMEDTSTPILMLTAFGELEDKANAFDSGADDYLVKPFHFEELLLRIKALLRRKSQPQQNQDILRIADLEINIPQALVTRAGKTISLSPKEFRLLEVLARAGGRVVSKSRIAEQLWDYTVDTSHNTIEVYINFLRRKIDKDFESKLIHTRTGYGYYLKAE
jgi:DNA-binding response OmpR family regulator